jgi:hypothetical protein
VRSDPRLVAHPPGPRDRFTSHCLQGLRRAPPAHHRCAAVVPERRSVGAHRAQALRADVGRARRRAPAPALRSLPPRDHALLAAVGQALRHPVGLPGRGDPLRARAEAALLRGHRRDRRGADDLDSRGAGLGADLGLPLLLAARLVLHARRVPPARALRGARAVPAVPPQRRELVSGASRSPRCTRSMASPAPPSRSSTTGPGSVESARSGSAMAPPRTSRTMCSARWCWP